MNAGKKEDHVKAENGYLQTKEKGLRKNQPCHHLDFRLLVSTCEKMNFCYLSDLVCGALLWQP